VGEGDIVDLFEPRIAVVRAVVADRVGHALQDGLFNA
jgi:hypothetical protein